MDKKILLEKDAKPRVRHTIDRWPDHPTGELLAFALRPMNKAGRSKNRHVAKEGLGRLSNLSEIRSEGRGGGKWGVLEMMGVFSNHDCFIGPLRFHVIEIGDKIRTRRNLFKMYGRSNSPNRTDVFF